MKYNKSMDINIKQTEKVMNQVRHELKYLINPAELMALQRRIENVAELDKHCKGGAPYHIRSLYFDDMNDSAFYDKLDGVKDRDKYRIRIYNLSDEVIFMERKRKVGDLIQKDAVRITRRLCDQIIAGDPTGLHKAASPLLQDVYVQMRTKLLHPAVIVDYSRMAYIYVAEHVRITFDLDVRSGLFNKDLFDPNVPTVSPFDANLQVLEVKFDRALPANIEAAIAGTSANRSAVSKYALCRRFEPLQADAWLI